MPLWHLEIYRSRAFGPVERAHFRRKKNLCPSKCQMPSERLSERLAARCQQILQQMSDERPNLGFTLTVCGLNESRERTLKTLAKQLEAQGHRVAYLSRSMFIKMQPPIFIDHAIIMAEQDLPPAWLGVVCPGRFIIKYATESGVESREEEFEISDQNETSDILQRGIHLASYGNSLILRPTDKVESASAIRSRFPNFHSAGCIAQRKPGDKPAWDVALWQTTNTHQHPSLYFQFFEQGDYLAWQAESDLDGPCTWHMIWVVPDMSPACLASNGKPFLVAGSVFVTQWFVPMSSMELF